MSGEGEEETADPIAMLRRIRADWTHPKARHNDLCRDALAAAYAFFQNAPPIAGEELGVPFLALLQALEERSTGFRSAILEPPSAGDSRPAANPLHAGLRAVVAAVADTLAEWRGGALNNPVKWKGVGINKVIADWCNEAGFQPQNKGRRDGSASITPATIKSWRDEVKSASALSEIGRIYQDQRETLRASREAIDRLRAAGQEIDSDDHSARLKRALVESLQIYAPASRRRPLGN